MTKENLKNWLEEQGFVLRSGAASGSGMRTYQNTHYDVCIYDVSELPTEIYTRGVLANPLISGDPDEICSWLMS